MKYLFTMYYHSVALYFTVYIVISHFKGTLYISYLDTKYYIRQMLLVSSSGVDGKACIRYTFTYRATRVHTYLAASAAVCPPPNSTFI